MDDWREAEEPRCPACDEPLDPTALHCPACDQRLIPDELADMIDSSGAPQPVEAPGWAVGITGLAIGVAIAPLVVYAARIAFGELSTLTFVVLGICGWVLPALVLSRYPNPSAALARGLYLIVAGVGLVIATISYDTVSPDPVVSSQQATVLIGILVLAGTVALLLARRIAARGSRQSHGGTLQERAGSDE
jgi:hypothetical protein